ncbi:MAG: hypothetical protein LBM07_05745, partial [Culturomica sp.]|nr:hypothetical protein [Culturomica sp.]
ENEFGNSENEFGNSENEFGNSENVLREYATGVYSQNCVSSLKNCIFMLIRNNYSDTLKPSWGENTLVAFKKQFGMEEN